MRSSSAAGCKPQAEVNSRFEMKGWECPIRQRNQGHSLMARSSECHQSTKHLKVRRQSSELQRKAEEQRQSRERTSRILVLQVKKTSVRSFLMLYMRPLCLKGLVSKHIQKTHTTKTHFSCQSEQRETESKTPTGRRLRPGTDTTRLKLDIPTIPFESK